ncbi:hypothetical protein NECAME_01540 [Necator americanus]|uniref:Reelin domain-containing protein n=1 Tax=Necator americanus TaxID=51031 RepID=W2TT62_NECAM|nr:hypothetical protein NECAME_01540 [Necator americanus]ETN84978.1 hypothetical protein NECAME_01540 [Necator americanus]
MRELLIALIIPLTTSISQVTTPTQGQCQAVCLRECKLGCGSPGFTELKLEPFKRGQAIYATIINQDDRSVFIASKSPIRNVALLCADSAENNGSVFWKVGLDVRNMSEDGMLAHWVEAVRRTNNDVASDTVVFSTWQNRLKDFFEEFVLIQLSSKFFVSYKPL